MATGKTLVPIRCGVDAWAGAPVGMTLAVILLQSTATSAKSIEAVAGVPAAADALEQLTIEGRREAEVSPLGHVLLADYDLQLAAGLRCDVLGVLVRPDARHLGALFGARRLAGASLEQQDQPHDRGSRPAPSERRPARSLKA